MKFNINKNKYKANLYLGLVLLVMLYSLVIVSYIFIENLFTKDHKNFLENIASRLQNDLKVENGQVDTTLYNSDPLTAYPNSSSSSPVYIILADGFVIERSKSINGFLDTSDLKHLLQFQTPTTLNSLTNETWRVLSKTITGNNSEVLGVVMVSYHNPEVSIMSVIDQKLNDSIQKIHNQVKVENNAILTRDIDIRNVDYTVSFEVVTNSNKVIVSNGRIPTFIDPSYVVEQARDNHIQNLEDKSTGERFIALSKTISSDSKLAGIIVVARSISFSESLLKQFLLFGFLLSTIAVLPISYITNRLTKRGLVIDPVQKDLDPKRIVFSKTESYVEIDSEKYDIVYSSHQYSMFKALFSKPTKRWENDELLEKFGDSIDSHNSKKVYDTALAINKKLGIKLVLYKDKTYSINPKYVNILEIR